MTVFILCLQIFLFRILDVSLGVMRTIVLVRRKTLLASMIGFVEVLIWFLIVRDALTSAEGGIFVALAYASGFAAGTFIGSMLSKKLIKTKINVQVITSSRDDNMVKIVRANGFPLTIIHAAGSGEKKTERYLLFIEINNYEFNRLKQLILSLDNKAFIFVNDLTNAVNGHFYERGFLTRRK